MVDCLFKRADLINLIKEHDPSITGIYKRNKAELIEMCSELGIIKNKDSVKDIVKQTVNMLKNDICEVEEVDEDEEEDEVEDEDEEEKVEEQKPTLKIVKQQKLKPIKVTREKLSDAKINRIRRLKTKSDLESKEIQIKKILREFCRDTKDLIKDCDTIENFTQDDANLLISKYNALEEYCTEQIEDLLPADVNSSFINYVKKSLDITQRSIEHYIYG